jgi:F-type H+-transporting ATPase subunit a
MDPMLPQAASEHAAQTAVEHFDAGKTIIEHVSNSSLAHPLIELPPVFGINFSVTKHVFMLWVVASVLFVVITWLVRRYLRQARLVPTGTMNALELTVDFVRDSIVEPNVGHKSTNAWMPFILTLFLFILASNVVGLIPIFDTLNLLDHYALHTSHDSFFNHLLHGGSTSTGNFNVTAGLAMVTFFAIIVAGSVAHGPGQHWKNALVAHGQPLLLQIFLFPIELLGMLVRPFALTMRLAANMTGGHIAILAILSFVFIFAEMLGSAAGVGIGLVFSVPLSVGVSGLEIIVVLVQAYVFSLLSAVFIGMAIHAHH